MINRVIENTKEQVAEEQGGLRSGWGCINQIFVLKQLVEKYREKRKNYMLHSGTCRRRMIKFAEKNFGECYMNLELMGT